MFVQNKEKTDGLSGESGSFWVPSTHAEESAARGTFICKPNPSGILVGLVPPSKKKRSVAGGGGVGGVCLLVGGVYRNVGVTF